MVLPGDKFKVGDVHELIDIYKQAQIELVNDMVKTSNMNFASVFIYKEAMLTQINAHLEELRRTNGAWVEVMVPEAYQAGLDQASNSIRTQFLRAGEMFPEFPGNFAIIHQEAVLSMINKTRDTFDGLIQHTGRALDDSISVATTEAIKMKLATGQTVRQAQLRIMKDLAENGIQAVTFKRNGKNVSMSLDKYGSMVARSTTREATNQASMRQAKEVGGDLVKMSSHIPCCEICFPYQGRVYSITGKTPGYPRLEIPFSSGYANIHPNCKHVINPYIAKFKSPEQLLRDQEFSNRSFDNENWTKAEQNVYNRQLDSYKVGQAKKASLNNDRKQFQRYQARMGDGAPGNFSSFRRMKNNPESWVDLQKKYRAAGASVKEEILTGITKADHTIARGFTKDLQAQIEDGIKRSQKFWAGGPNYTITPSRMNAYGKFYTYYGDARDKLPGYHDWMEISTKYKGVKRPGDRLPYTQLIKDYEVQLAAKKELLENAAYSWTDGEIYKINRDIRSLERALKSTTDSAKLYPGWSASNTFAETTIHELGHGLYYEILRGNVGPVAQIGERAYKSEFLTKIRELQRSNGPVISQYATKKPEEYFAEAWSVYVQDVRRGDLDPYMIDLFDKISGVR